MEIDQVEEEKNWGGNKYNAKWKELQSAYNVQMVVVGELNLIE